jgi:hypothetical protein
MYDQLTWFPQSFDWEKHNAKEYFYFFVKIPENYRWLSNEKVTLIAQSGQWRLYKNNHYQPSTIKNP